MDSPQKQDPFLFILLGFDTLYSINLNHLHLLKEEEEEDLRIVFSHETHKYQQPSSRNPYPIGMGLFVHNSKLHFFGGENIKPDDDFEKISFGISKLPPKQIDYSIMHMLHTMQNLDEWINKKVFSFTPIFKLDDQPPALIPVECDFPSPSSYKMRPIVFTVSDKVYALATRPFNGTLVDAVIEESEQDGVFEVFEPSSNINNGIIKWQWTKLPNPPESLSIVMSRRRPHIFHCVIKNQLLLQTLVGDFIFDLITKKWLEIPSRGHDHILASLEYKDILLLFYGGGAGYLVAYDLKSFELYNMGLSSLGLPSLRLAFQAVWKKTILDAGPINDYGTVFAASLSIVDDNSICLVLSCYTKLYVCHFEFIKPPCKFHLKAHKKFHLPSVMTKDPHTLSSFVLKEDVGKSNQDSTTGKEPPTKKRNDLLSTGFKNLRMRQREDVILHNFPHTPHHAFECELPSGST